MNSVKTKLIIDHLDDKIKQWDNKRFFSKLDALVKRNLLDHFEGLK
jgi:hypothetical protein